MHAAWISPPLEEEEEEEVSSSSSMHSAWISPPAVDVEEVVQYLAVIVVCVLLESALHLE
jgi:hypothetical protein